MKIFLALASVSLVKVAVRRTFSNNKNWTEVRKFTLETKWCKKRRENEKLLRKYKTIITVVSTFPMHRWEKTSDALKRKCFCTDYFELTLKPSLISHLLILYQIWICKKYFFPLCPLQTCNWAQVSCPALWAFFPAFLPGCKNILCLLPSSFYIHVLIVTWLQFKDSDLGPSSASELHLDPFLSKLIYFQIHI